MTGKKNINIFDLLDRLRPPGLHGRRYPNLLNSKLFLTIPPRKNFPITLFSHRYTLIITDIFSFIVIVQPITNLPAAGRDYNIILNVLWFLCI
jgi:hypothetical protein